MCNSEFKSRDAAPVAQIDGRPVLQPACNRVATLEGRGHRQLKKSIKNIIPSPPISVNLTNITKSPITVDDARSNSASPSTPKLKPVKQRNVDPNGLNSSTEKPQTPRSTAVAVTKRQIVGLAERAPGSIAAAQREQATLMQAQRKMRIAHYGRKATKIEGIKVVVPIDISNNITAFTGAVEEKRCSFITSNSDPIFIAYHDEEWGVPVHDDRMLFELLVLTGAQVGLDWTTILKKRDDFREAFAEFDAEVVAKFSEKRMATISASYGFELAKVRGTVDNANRILEVRRQFGSFDKYIWCFVNHKPLITNYKLGRKIPAKTSKSESISKDLVRRGFRSVGPTVVHSFMQAAGLTNDHLLSCPRHRLCSIITDYS